MTVMDYTKNEIMSTVPGRVSWLSTATISRVISGIWSVTISGISRDHLEY